ncbi:hypothetical protein OSH11_03610 [Kaistia dalseonensis]|uniref:Uncharacterized protein n=1 Tax=Kaistia dalseonensis TaxID=410840 RepID=A0ABU0H371_9HYPH|nr:hypothetical protein [Kaistia dalseonensis]MCX5493784.1 hypothetical protein [Kaistia dalseonensis]MDQ0436348.1 hypothetical protein [Kaistia dalseonensis]
MSRLRYAAAVSAATIGLVLVGASTGFAQTSQSQTEQMEKDLGMDATPDQGALSFVDDISTLEECQSGCRAVINQMLKKYKGGVKAGGNAKLGADDITQLGAALAVAAATLSKDEAASVEKQVSAELGPEADTAYSAAYAAAVAPYAPK